MKDKSLSFGERLYIKVERRYLPRKRSFIRDKLAWSFSAAIAHQQNHLPKTCWFGKGWQLEHFVCDRAEELFRGGLYLSSSSILSSFSKSPSVVSCDLCGQSSWAMPWIRFPFAWPLILARRWELPPLREIRMLGCRVESSCDQPT